MRYLIAAVIVGFAVGGCKSIDMSPAGRGVRAFRHIREGDRLLGNGDLDGSIKEYEAALELTPNAPRFRFAYAQLLYWKALGYDQDSHLKWQQRHGRDFDFETLEWAALNKKLSSEKKGELLKTSKEDMRQAIIYYKKSLQELTRCDFEWNQAVESVPFAMGMVYFMLVKYDEAIRCFERVLESGRASDSYREKMTKAIKLLREHKRKVEEEEPEEVEERPGLRSQG